MQTIQELADCFFTKYSEEAIKNDSRALSSTMYHKRLCEQVRQMIEFHVEAALKTASENAETDYELGNPYDPNSRYEIVNKESILNAYPLENIK